MRTSRQRGQLAFSGASDQQPSSDRDTPLITNVIASEALCSDCIAHRTGLKPWQAENAIPSIGKTLTIDSRMAKCQACLKRTIVHRLS